MPLAEVEGRKVYYEIHGDRAGVPLVLVMGMGGSCRGWLPLQVPDFSAEHRTLIERVGLLDESTRTIVGVQGDRAGEMLHGLLTNDVKRLSVGEGLYAFMLTPKGRPVAEMRLLRLESGFWMAMPASCLVSALAHLRKYLPPIYARFDETAETPHAEQICNKGIALAVPCKKNRAARKLALGFGDALRRTTLQFEFSLEYAVRPIQRHEVGTRSAAQTNSNRLQAVAA